MSLFTVGRLCFKIAGRDAGNQCVVVEVFDNNYVLVDGNVRRKKVNVKHLEPLADVIEIKESASHDEINKVFDKFGLATWNKKSKNPAERTPRTRKRKEKVTELKIEGAIKEEGSVKKKSAKKKEAKKKEE